MRLPHDAGITLTELIVVLALAVSTAGASLPAFESGLDALRIRHAAGVIASRARLARQEAVVRSRHVGLVFDRTASGWRMSVCRDGNGNGLRRLEIGTGVDRCAADPDLVNALIPGVEVAVDPGLRGPDGEAGSADAHSVWRQRHGELFTPRQLHGRDAVPPIAARTPVRGADCWSDRADADPQIRRPLVGLGRRLMRGRVFLDRDVNIVREVEQWSGAGGPHPAATWTSGRSSPAFRGWPRHVSARDRAVVGHRLAG